MLKDTKAYSILSVLLSILIFSTSVTAIHSTYKQYFRLRKIRAKTEAPIEDKCQQHLGNSFTFNICERHSNFLVNWKEMQND